MEKDPSSNTREHRKRQLDYAHHGAFVFILGEMGVLASDLLAPTNENIPLSYFLVKLISHLAVVSGGGVSLYNLINIGEFARTHIHPGLASSQHEHLLIDHRHETVPDHKHEATEITAVDPPSWREEAISLLNDQINRNNLNDNYKRDLLSLGISVRSSNALKYAGKPLAGMPLSISGLRLFLALGEVFPAFKEKRPIIGRNIGSVATSEISEKVIPIIYPETAEDYAKLTDSEKKQMIENGFTQSL